MTYFDYLSWIRLKGWNVYYTDRTLVTNRLKTRAKNTHAQVLPEFTFYKLFRLFKNTHTHVNHKLNLNTETDLFLWQYLRWLGRSSTLTLFYSCFTTDWIPLRCFVILIEECVISQHPMFLGVASGAAQLWPTLITHLYKNRIFF